MQIGQSFSRWTTTGRSRGAPIICLKVLADALDALSDKRDLLDRLEAAYRRKIGGDGAAARQSKAAAQALLKAQTQVLASVQLEIYLSKLISNKRGNLVPSGVQLADRAAADKCWRASDIGYRLRRIAEISV